MANGTLLFILLLGIALVSRYPKMRISNGGIIIDLSEMSVFLTTHILGLKQSLLMILLCNCLPMLYMRMEGPLETFIRINGMLLGLMLFFIMQNSGFLLIHSIISASVLSALIWAIAGLYLTNFSDPMFVVMAIAKGAVYYKILIFAKL